MIQKKLSIDVCQSPGEVEDWKAVLYGRTWQKFVADICMQQAQFDLTVVDIRKHVS